MRTLTCNSDSSWWRFVFFCAGWAITLFYLMTAHLSVGQMKDFGCLWMGGKIVATGQGQALYSPDLQTQILRAEFDEEIVDELQNVSGEVNIGRLPYPPVQAVVYAPLGFLSPRTAQTMMGYLSVLAALISANAIHKMSRGKILLSMAVIAILIQPAFFSTLALGQNSAITLAIICVGMQLWKSDRDFTAGLCWGLLAYKPTWGLAIAWIPLVSGRPRAYLGMGISVTGLVLLTIPLTGLNSWFTWLELAKVFENAENPLWDMIRRDSRNLVSHVFTDVPPLITLGMLLVVVMVTGLALWKNKNTTQEGFASAAVFAAIVLSCSRFMYYDLILTSPAWLVAFSNWKRVTPTSKTILILLVAIYLLAPVIAFGAWPRFWPVETATVLGLWVWDIFHLVKTAPVIVSSDKSGKPLEV